MLWGFKFSADFGVCELGYKVKGFIRVLVYYEEI